MSWFLVPGSLSDAKGGKVSFLHLQKIRKIGNYTIYPKIFHFLNCFFIIYRPDINLKSCFPGLVQIIRGYYINGRVNCFGT